MKIAGRDCGCAKRKQWLKDRGLWPGGKPRHQAKATRVHPTTKQQLLEDIAEAEAQIEEMEFELNEDDDFIEDYSSP